jgi:hemerythrin superfamily protein
MDALELLTADHNRVRGLFKRFKGAEERDDAATKAEVVAKIVEDLTVHTTIEEEIFYPAVTDLDDEVHDLVTEGIEEHRVAKDLLEQVKGLDADDEEWTAKVKVLIENVEHHAEEEENEMFPKIRSAMASDARDELGQRLEARKKELGAPTTDDAIDLTKEELLAKAKEQEIPGRSTMSTDELAATVDPRS